MEKLCLSSLIFMPIAHVVLKVTNVSTNQGLN